MRSGIRGKSGSNERRVWFTPLPVKSSNARNRKVYILVYSILIMSVKLQCVECHKWIEGLTEKQVLHLLRIHNTSHPKTKVEVTEENNISSDLEVEE